MLPLPLGRGGLGRVRRRLCTWERGDPPGWMLFFVEIPGICVDHQDWLTRSHVRAGGSAHMGADQLLVTGAAEPQNHAENRRPPRRGPPLPCAVLPQAFSEPFRRRGRCTRALGSDVECVQRIDSVGVRGRCVHVRPRPGRASAAPNDMAVGTCAAALDVKPDRSRHERRRGRTSGCCPGCSSRPTSNRRTAGPLHSRLPGPGPKVPA